MPKKTQAQEGEASQPLMSTPYRSTQAIGKGVIDQIKPQLDAKWESVVAVPKTHKMHCIIPKGKGMVMVSDTYSPFKETILYARDDIVRTRNPPRAAGHHEQFLFNQL